MQTKKSINPNTNTNSNIIHNSISISNNNSNMNTNTETNTTTNINNPQVPVFNIRKVNNNNNNNNISNSNNNKKIVPNHVRNQAEYHPHGHHNVYGHDVLEYQGRNAQIYNINGNMNNKGVNSRKEKQLMLDQTVNQSIIKSKLYGDLKKVYLTNKKKQSEDKKQLQTKISAKKKQKLECLSERQRLESQKVKYMEVINSMKQKIEVVRETNQRYREALANKVSGEAQYISNLIMSMRFQAQYEHGIDPDKMTYEQLLELQQKIGIVSRGLPKQLIQYLPKIQIKNQKQQSQRCTVCFSNYEVGQVMTVLFSCKHQFHFQCLESWLGKEKTCPLCKREIEFQNGGG